MLEARKKTVLQDETFQPDTLVYRLCSFAMHGKHRNLHMYREWLARFRDKIPRPNNR